MELNASERNEMTVEQIETKIQRISDDYNAGLSLRSIIESAGTDEASLRLIHSRLGKAMSTLRYHAEEIEKRTT